VRGGAPARDSVDVKTTFDETTSVPFSQFLAARDGLGAELASTFGAGVDGLFAPATHRDLVGRQVGSMRVLQDGGARVEIDAPSQFEDVDPDAPVLPIALSGRLRGVPDEPRLAIALNGRIAIVAESYEDRGEIVFSALVPPSALRAGPNTVAVFGLRGAGDEPTLVALRQSEQLNYRLADHDGEQVLEAPGGDAVPVGPGAAEGFVEDVSEGRTGPVVVTGWAMGAEGRVERVLLFAGDRFVGATTASQERPDVAESRGGGPLKTGFSLSASGDMLGEEELRVFAIASGRASLLPRLESP
jgi:hypothetical protein